MQNPIRTRFCTILTDASWCPDEFVAGWAAWIVCDEGRYTRYDAFLEPIPSAQDAEIKAILNGLFIARRLFNPEAFHVVTDCVGAIDVLNNKANPKNKLYNELLQSIIKSDKLSFKHVKAHVKIQDKRSYVNDWCDFHAKMAMRQQRTHGKKD